jgi:hypothetical protein
MQKMKYAMWVLFITVLANMSCLGVTEYDKRDGSHDRLYVITVDSSGPGGFHAVFPDGTVFDEAQGYADFAANVVEATKHDDQELVVTFGAVEDGPEALAEAVPNISTGDLGVSEQALNSQGRRDLPLSFVATWSIEDRKWINGCMKRFCTPGAAFRLHRNGWQIADVHVGRYFNGTLKCYGVYESQLTGWTACTCLPNLNQLTANVRNAIIAAGVTYATAELITAALVPLVLVPALAL